MAQTEQSGTETAIARSGSRGGQVRPARIIAEPGRQEFVVIREFDAPRDLVFRAYTDPELYAQWIGPRTLSTAIETFEPRSGGRWRYIQKDPQGNEFGFHGVHHDVTPPERIIETFEYEGLPEPGHVILQRADFEELPENHTRVTSRSVFLSVEDRDGMLQSDMEEGMNDSFSRLDELLERLQRSRSGRGDLQH
ncbi:MAG: SRPBCC family protein [Methanomicrobiales archaeon]|nr:SRPBCC family protein [Methanomicrobiales archaeon]MDI6876966.1 SRPBCC family protein [Methanomicrobiales archaeon]